MLTGHRTGSVLLLATIAIVGCAPQEVIIEPQPPSFGPPLIEPLPLRVGYGFDPSVDREVYAPPGSDVRSIARLGPATRAAFARVFAAALADAVDLAGETSPRGSAEKLDGTIRLGVATASVQGASWKDSGAASALFELVFLNPDGTEEGGWQVPGGAAGAGQRNAELAIRAAAAKVAMELAQQPAIRAWLERDAPGRIEE